MRHSGEAVAQKVEWVVHYCTWLLLAARQSVLEQNTKTQIARSCYYLCDEKHCEVVFFSAQTKKSAM